MKRLKRGVKKYPDVAKIVDTIAQKRANEALRIGEERLKKVEQFEKTSSQAICRTTTS